jgi:predicted phage tail protein
LTPRSLTATWGAVSGAVPATSSGSLTVSWASASTATSYTLQHQLNSGSWSTIYTGTGTSKAVTETASGSYVYRVEACNGGGCSGYKTSTSVTVTIPPSSAPSLSVPSSSTGSYTVSWGSVSGATSYTLQEQVNGGGWSTSYTGSGTSKAYSGKTLDSTYGYRIQACNAGGCSAWSATKSVAIVLPAPSNVQKIEHIGFKVTTLTATWDAVSGASRYEVKLDSSSTIVYSGSNTSYALGSASTPDTPPDHTVYVRACDAVGCSDWATASATVIQ